MHNQASRVFITQESSSLNYSDAEQFGELVFLTRDEVSPVAGSLINTDLMNELTNKLVGFDFDRDYLVPSGSPVVCGLAFLTLGMRLGEPGSRVGRMATPKCLRVLRWSNRDRMYQPITLNV